MDFVFKVMVFNGPGQFLIEISKKPNVHAAKSLFKDGVKMMDFAIKTRICVLKTRNYVSKNEELCIKMMNFAELGIDKPVVADSIYKKIAILTTPGHSM